MVCDRKGDRRKREGDGSQGTDIKQTINRQPKTTDMNTKKIMIKASLALAIMLCTTMILSAQPGGGGQAGGGSPPPGTGAPIDGGAGLFLAAVAGYAHRKLKATKE
jgi:hypothetical protein